MRVAHISTTIDRKTGEVLKREITGYKEVDEDRYYGPLVKIWGDRILKEFREGRL